MYSHEIEELLKIKNHLITIQDYIEIPEMPKKLENFIIEYANTKIDKQ